MDNKKEGPGRFIYLKKRQMFEGEWFQDVAQCGTIVQFPNSTPVHPIPIIQLLDYKMVIEESICQIQKQREEHVMVL